MSQNRDQFLEELSQWSVPCGLYPQAEEALRQAVVHCRAMGRPDTGLVIATINHRTKQRQPRFSMRWHILIAAIIGGLYLWAGHVAGSGAEEAAFEAAMRGDTRLLVEELDRGVDVNVSSMIQGRTLLMAAAGAGRAETVRGLLARGADPNQSDNIGFTPMMLAAGRGHTDVVVVLMQAGASRSGTSPAGKTAVVMARDSGHEEVVSVLSR